MKTAQAPWGLRGFLCRIEGGVGSDKETLSLLISGCLWRGSALFVELSTQQRSTSAISQKRTTAEST